MKTFKILGLMLVYPDREWHAAVPAMQEVLEEEGLLPKKIIAGLNDFLQHLSSRDLLDIQEDYVDTFDRSRAHCLHLFEHIHGESRDRGQAMVNLVETYAARKLYISNNELPDYLPLFLEYLSHCPLPEAKVLLGEAVDIIATIGVKLQRRRSPYASVFAAIEALSAVKPDQAKLREILAAAPKDPETLDEIDEAWREAEAFSGDPVADGAQGGCNAFPNATQPLEKVIEIRK